jgi:polysaccharide export outer membrane protein
MASRRLSVWFAAALSAALAGAAGAQQVALPIGARDQLSISVWNAGVSEEMFTGKFTVDVDGAFEYPTFGRVKAGGLTTRELEAQLTAMLEKYLVSPQVTVGLESSSSKKVVVAGQVRTPAAYQFTGHMTLFEAITRAGGVTADAADEAIVHRTVMHSNGETRQESIRVDLYALMAGDSLDSNVALQDDDTIVVPKADPVFITGFVRTQGQYPVRRGMTVQQALALAGGLSDRGSSRGIKIQRVVDGKKQEIAVRDMNTELVRAGDTINVPARIF